VKLLYQPMLECAVRYDRLTGYFSASALALAARGVEGLVLNGGRMRMVVGCTLDPPEVEAIQRGEELRAQVDRHLTAMPLMPTDPSMAKAAYTGEGDQPFRLIVITESGDRDHAQGGPKCPGRDGRRSAPPT